MASIHPKAAPDAKIVEFWRWFQTIANDLAANFENERLLVELDERVSELGDVLWELGPGKTEENALVITPDGSKDWLPVTQHIVELAPRIAGWEFQSARLPRDWDMQFSIESAGGTHLDIDARPWRYVLFKYPDDTFDIVLEQNNLHSVSDDDRYAAAVVLLDGTLGERRRLALLGGIEAVETFSADLARKANPMHHLVQHLDSLELN
ncbi:MAG: hypothetical protein IPM54_41170 [Polyangiaceae bacterium]|nr:hypothetical protein [Polyangiaceae bacterium]